MSSPILSEADSVYATKTLARVMVMGGRVTLIIHTLMFGKGSVSTANSRVVATWSSALDSPSVVRLFLAVLHICQPSPYGDG